MGQNGKKEFVFPFEKLEVWQLAVDLADFIFSLLESFPPNKHLFETLTLAEVMRRRKLFSDNDAMEIRERSEAIDRKLHGLINSVRSRS
jgi:hypothetical protein